jgi:hypothetical protein
MATTQQSIEKLNKYTERLELLNKQLEKINKNTKEYKKLTTEKNKVEEKAIKASKELANAQSKLSSTLPNHKRLIKEASEAQKRFNKNTENGSKNTKNFFERLKTATGTLLRYSLAYKAINLAQTLFSEITAGSIKQSIEFEKALANLGAVAGATSEEVEMLGKNALDVAGSTKFTAQEIVNMQTELSKLGFTSEEVVKSTQSISFAAQALGSPLDSTAALVGKLKNQFGLLIEETTMISDILVTSINESALSFESFGTAMQYVGPIAKNLGLSLEQTTAAMAVLADNGFTASRIGTGLRGIFTELGKTSADVEASLMSLAEANLSLGEAVELVGKRNAAQLLTLLKNIDAIDEANDRYYQHGRALVSAAKQADTFSGQMDILISNFREFQIGLGNVVVDSNLFIKALGFLSEKAQETALGFRTLRDVGIKGFEEDVNSVIENGVSPLTQSLNRMVESGKISKNNLGNLSAAFKEAEELSKEFGESITPTQERLEELGVTKEQFSALQGYFRLIETGVEKQREQIAITKGQATAAKVYGKEVEALIQSSLEGNNVNEEAQKIQEGLVYTIDNLTKSIKKSSGETRIELEAEKKAYESLLEQVINTYLSKSELAKIQLKEEKRAAKEEIKIIKNDIKERIDAINERAKVESEIAEGAAERADIEAERQKLVSDLYVEQADRIGQLNGKYITQKQLIDDNVKAAEKLSEVLGSDVINDINKAYKDYEEQLKDLKKARKEDKISQEDYEDGVTELRNQLINTIATFRELFGTSPELEKFFDMVIMNFDATTVAADKTGKKTEEVAKTIDDFFKEFKEGGYLEYVEQLFVAIGQSLDEFNKTATENTKAELDSQLDSIKNRYEVEQDILKSQLDNQLITETQFRQKQLELRKAQVAEENTINKGIFEAEKEQDINDAKIEGAVAAAKAAIKAIEKYGFTPAGLLASTLGAGIVTAQTATQISAINQRKFFPKKYEQGGVVNGPSHAEGGVPFTVQGKAGYEMEGGEFIVNKRATAMHRDLLERINNSQRTRPQVGRMKFAEGGLVPNNPAAESVDYLKAIAEATTSTAVNSKKPVRAFVADKDLRNNANERRLRDRNDRI